MWIPPFQPQAVSNNTRSKKVQNKPKCPESVADSARPSKSKMGNGQAAEESVTATKPHSISIEECPETGLISPAPSTSNNSCPANFVTNNHVPGSGKKEQAKLAPQKHRGVSDSSNKGPKKQSSEGDKSGETTKHRNETMKKGVRNVGLRSSSRSGNNNITVRVAS